ncbi:SIR2 family protein [uncultured Vagococcus sp.]|uniref:SIR2 family protein n=1 Tax=uncultured Vagococcus sp. TaxID=189676 RepID=UPI0025874DFB|nr:SIR2 family protein [uncultured Vagococcus sp.]
MSISKLEILNNILPEKQITFLLGAGASAPFFSSLVNIENILSDSSVSIEAKELVKLIFFEKSISDNEYLIKNLEGFCICGEKKELLLEILNNYENFIYTINEIMKLKNSRVSPKRTNIITTNYDLFIESAIEHILQDNNRIFYNDGASGYINRTLSSDNYNKTLMYSGVFDNYSSEMPTINLIKCHGSINWKEVSYVEKRSRILVESKFEQIKDINSLIKSNTEQINKLLSQSDIKLNEGNKIFTMEDIANLLCQKYDEELKKKLNLLGTQLNTIIKPIVEKIEKLQIVLPTKRKFQTTLIEEQYFNMLRFLSYELEKEQSALIVFGFSFYDEHITEIVQRSLNNPSLLVIIFCYKDSDKDEIISRFAFSNNSIPNNVIFIKPEDLILETVTREEFGDKTNELALINPNHVQIYDERITIRKTGKPLTDAYSGKQLNEAYPYIDFKSFNKILETNISNKFMINKSIKGDTHE